MQNLAGNAIDHAPQAGHVTVEAAPVEGASVRVTVTDDGPGIEPEDLPHVFERYWRKESTKRKGTGLGLYIARGIVEAHGGSLDVDSAPGHGSTFSFTLPIAGPRNDDR